MCKDFKNWVTNNGSVDKYELGCSIKLEFSIKVPFNKSGSAETTNKTQHKRYISNCANFIIVTFRFSTSWNHRNQTKLL